MELIDQHTKGIMEGCKERAREAGLRFQDETLEYVVTNRDMLELTPKLMIPTLYDYWVHDVEVLREKGRYELYPSNPYETVINTRPPISFYNDNNPDWLNVMIFYHVLAHIDFFQNNLYFRNTRDYDFTGLALSDKREIARLRALKGRWVDYIVEFARGIDNLAGFHEELSRSFRPPAPAGSAMLDYYFDVFLQEEKKVRTSEYVKEMERYNQWLAEGGRKAGRGFFAEVRKRHPEFEAMFRAYRERKPRRGLDLMQFILEHSEFLGDGKNKWMKGVVEIVRKTSLFFQPQIRTKILNEGWASYWHETLFLQDDRIRGHEVDFARVNAGVVTMPRVGLNPYALGMKLFQYIEEQADRGKLSLEYRRLLDAGERERFDNGRGNGRETIFALRENLSDFLLIHNFVDQEFVDRNRLFVAGRRLDRQRMVWQYYVKSRDAGEYRRMLNDSLYHPPHILIEQDKCTGKTLYLNHVHEGKPLVRDFIANTLLGIEYLWGGPVKLETSEAEVQADPSSRQAQVMFPGLSRLAREEEDEPEVRWQRVLYTMQNRKLTRSEL